MPGHDHRHKGRRSRRGGQDVFVVGDHIAANRFPPIKILAYEPKKEYQLRFKDFMAWLDRQDRRPSHLIHKEG